MVEKILKDEDRMAEILSKISATFKRRKGSLAIIILLVCAGVAGFLLWGRKAAASDYISLYQGDQATLAESLEVIQKTSAEILRAIAPVQDPMR